MPAFKVQGLDHVALSVSDLKRSSAFYAEVLGLERAYDGWHEPVFMVAEGTGLALFSTESHESSGDPDAKPPVRFLNVAFRVAREGFDAARADPDGHKVELTTYEV